MPKQKPKPDNSNRPEVRVAGEMVRLPPNLAVTDAIKCKCDGCGIELEARIPVAATRLWYTGREIGMVCNVCHQRHAVSQARVRLR